MSIRWSLLAPFLFKFSRFGFQSQSSWEPKLRSCVDSSSLSLSLSGGVPLPLQIYDSILEFPWCKMLKCWNVEFPITSHPPPKFPRDSLQRKQIRNGKAKICWGWVQCNKKINISTFQHVTPKKVKTMLAQRSFLTCAPTPCKVTIPFLVFPWCKKLNC